jgi:hypothetical protein
VRPVRTPSPTLSQSSPSTKTHAIVYHLLTANCNTVAQQWLDQPGFGSQHSTIATNTATFLKLGHLILSFFRARSLSGILLFHYLPCAAVISFATLNCGAIGPRAPERSSHFGRHEHKSAKALQGPQFIFGRRVELP